MSKQKPTFLFLIWQFSVCRELFIYVCVGILSCPFIFLSPAYIYFHHCFNFKFCTPPRAAWARQTAMQLERKKLKYSELNSIPLSLSVYIFLTP